MTVYYFNVRDGAGGILDPDGTELCDLAAAKVHAVGVVHELLKFDEIKKRPWRLEVCDRQGNVVINVPFATVDPTLDHLQATTRDLVERMCESRERLRETIFRSQSLMGQSHALRADTIRGPYLIVDSGKRVA